MPNTSGNGSVSQEDIRDYIEKHPLPGEGQKYSGKEKEAYCTWYERKAGGFVKTNRGNEYRNSDDSRRLDQHAMWDLGRAMKPKTTKGEIPAEGEGNAPVQSGAKGTSSRKKAAA